MMTTSDPISICWFRRDLRTDDHPALAASAVRGRVLPVFIWDADDPHGRIPGAASRWWLHESLTALNDALDGHLALFSGDPEKLLPQIAANSGASAVYWHQSFEVEEHTRDERVAAALRAQDISVDTFNGSLLWPPGQVTKADGTPYRVFTPFYRKGCLNAAPPRTPIERPRDIKYVSLTERTNALADFKFVPSIPWYKTIATEWAVGEQAASRRLDDFLERSVSRYKLGRDFPALNTVSRLSPHLHFGEISPHRVWHTVRSRGDTPDIDHFCNELGWREFSYHLLHHNPRLATDNLQAKFDQFPWRSDEVLLDAWQRGATGYPIVDAGMRELWQTGYMHNRVRMIVGSFLVKNLRIDWRAGERWFWDCLVDADHANNAASWQWVAGCGADAAPYFRIFNPVTQGQKFDGEGTYTRRFVPELAALPDRYLFSPWQAPNDVLAAAGVRLGDTYPEPIVDLKTSRQAALDAFKSLS